MEPMPFQHEAALAIAAGSKQTRNDCAQFIKYTSLGVDRGASFGDGQHGIAGAQGEQSSR